MAANKAILDRSSPEIFELVSSDQAFSSRLDGIVSGCLRSAGDK